MAESDDLVRLTAVPDEGAATILCGLLEGEGIVCMHRAAEGAAGLGDGLISFGGWREILVRRADLERARELAEPAQE